MAKKVLLIEYEPRSVERVRSLLPPSEYSVTVAHDGEEGLNTFSSSSHFDLVVLSGMLPRLPSAEVIREIRRKGGAAAPPILLLVTGYKGTNRKADAQRVGAFDIIVKPYSDDDLKAAVSEAIESTDLAVKTIRITTAELLKAPAALTSSDIFSEILEDVGAETPPARPPTPSTEDAVEKRLRDTLSGVLGKRMAPRGPALPPMPRPAAAASATARFSTDAEIDKMISDTLSGIKLPARVRPTATAPPPAIPAAPPAATPSKPVEPVAVPISGSGPDRFGQYEILERIASGGMAELYKARRSGVEGFQKIVAIKRILPHLADNDEFIAMFADEAKLAAQLNHPNIVHIFDLGKIEAGGYFIAMEYVDGRDLKALLSSARESGTPLPTALAVYIASKVASALDYAHRRRDTEGRELNIVHRDISPQNILISYEGDIKLCDFGIAKAATKASQTQSGALKGKVQYMSPEQAWGRSIDRRSDLFSLGSVLFELLTDEKLFRGDTDLTVLEKVRAAEVTPPSSVNPEVPKNLDTIVLKALTLSPEERYANASDMLRDLEAILYAYTPAPGSADLAIYLHRLQAEEVAAQEARAREAARVATVQPERKRKSKGTPVARRTGSVPKLVVPPAPLPEPAAERPRKEPTASGVFGAFSSKRAEAEKKSRAPLYGMIGFAVVALAVAAWWALNRPAASVATVSPATPLPMAASPAVLPGRAAEGATTPAPAPPATLDPRAVEEEVRRQLAAREKELQKTLEGGAKTPRDLPAKKGEPSPAPEPTQAPPEPSPIRAEATAVPVATEAPSVPSPRPEPPAPEVSRGDLVGPGAGVVEPSLLGAPRVSYPPMARQQRVAGKVVVLVLVDEDGNVLDSRLQQGVATKSGVNEAVVAAVRRARFRPATKDGIPVKMWRTVVVDVKP